MSKHLAAWVALTTWGAACAEPLPRAPTIAEGDGDVVRVAQTQRNMVRASPDAPELVFLNRCIGGCTLNGGTHDDARVSQSVLAADNLEMPEYPWHDSILWPAVLECVRQTFSPYQVQVATEDPGPDVDHFETIISGTPDLIGMPANVGGVSPLDCTLRRNGVNFVFGEGYPLEAYEDIDPLCRVIVHEAGHTMGLEHTYECRDPMSYHPWCRGLPRFARVDSPCGEFEPRGCSCETPYQNSDLRLRALLGERQPSSEVTP